MNQLYAAVIGLVVGAAGAWVKAVLAMREKAAEELRARRLAAYPPAWRESGLLSYWPPAELTHEDLFDLNLRLRVWYFTEGGLYLSAKSRKRYGELKLLICAVLDRWNSVETDGKLDRERYDDLAKTCTAFRNSLTEDLETRRQRSLWWTLVSWFLHLRSHFRWRKRIARVGGRKQKLRAHPVDEMPLPPLESPAVTERTE